MTTETRLMTLEEFLALPETKPYTELIDGVRCQKPVGKPRHSRAQAKLFAALLTSPRTAAGTVWPELGFRFPRTTLGNLRVPSVSYYAPGSVDPQVLEGYPDRAPDLAAEVRSEGQSVVALQHRLSFLREQGTVCTLLIDPDKRTVEVRDGDHAWLAGEHDEVTLVHLNGFAFQVADLFR